MIIAHRGNGKHGFLENTKEAIWESLNSDDTDGVEFDIRMTKDKKLVLSHNAFFKEHLIAITNYQELLLDLLNTVLKGIKSKKVVIIEIKDRNLEVIPILYKILKKFSYLNIYIHSFHYNLLKEWKKRYPKYKVGLIKTNIINQNKDDKIFDFLSIAYWSYEKKDKPVFIWTVNKKDDLKKWTKHNVDIITDKPYIFHLQK